MIDTAVAQLLTNASELPPLQVRPGTELVRVTDGLTRLVFTQIGGERSYNDDGSDGVTPARYQLDYFAPTLTAARTLADKVRGVLDGFKGTRDDTAILRIHFPSDRFTAGNREAGANNPTARFTQECVVTYRDSV
ncbi:MAG: hypothetical protein QM754_00700 [Tepidisphaeraceae bacterium]